MGLFTGTQEVYYNQSQSKWSTNPNGTVVAFTATDVYFPTLTSLTKSDIRVFVNDVEIDTANYGFAQPRVTFTGNTGNTDVLEDDGAPKDGATLMVKERAATENYGNYQYTSINNVINNFLISHVGEDKIISRA